jgi:hypothetical protein
MWTSLGYGTREQDQALFRGIARSLQDGGLFLYETHVYETLLPRFEDRDWRRAGDVLVIQDREFDTETGRLHVEWTLTKSGVHERKRSAIQLYTMPEIDRMLETAGMKTVASWGSWELDAFELGAPILIGLAQKR